MVRLTRLVAIMVLIAAVPNASAAVMVLGSGPEQACYLASKTGVPSRNGVRACDEALEQSDLTTRDRAATHVNRSVLLLASEKPARALADTDMALTMSPGLEEAIVNRSAALILLGRFAEARTILDEALPRTTGRLRISYLFNRALASEALGDVKSAYNDLQQSLELDPEFEGARRELARFQVSTHRDGVGSRR